MTNPPKIDFALTSHCKDKIDQTKHAIDNDLNLMRETVESQGGFIDDIIKPAY